MKKNNENRVCKRCRSIFIGEPLEFICPTCLDSEKRAAVKKQKINAQQLPPQNPWIECLIQREGNTTAGFGGVAYLFRENSAGAKVCKVTNPAHHRNLLKFPELYRLYQPIKTGLTTVLETAARV